LHLQAFFAHLAFQFSIVCAEIRNGGGRNVGKSKSWLRQRLLRLDYRTTCGQFFRQIARAVWLLSTRNEIPSKYQNVPGASGALKHGPVLAGASILKPLMLAPQRRMEHAHR
jgi:hypothetical protein